MPGTYKLKLTVKELSNVMLTYPETEMHRTTTGLVADLALFDTKTLVADQVLYEFIDTGGEDSYAAAFRYHNDAGPLNSAFSPLIQYGTSSRWYASIQDLRAQGVSDSDATDGELTALIRTAQSWFEGMTKKHFYSEEKTIRIDCDGGAILYLPEPPIRIDSISVEVPSADGVTTEDIDLNSVRIYNRHLTMRMLVPDDRVHPKLELVASYMGLAGWRETFPETRQGVKVTGLFGYTELYPEDLAGETVYGSQVPLNWGQVPPDVHDVIMRLVFRSLPKLGDVDDEEDAKKRGSVKQHKTKDQSTTFFSPKDLGLFAGLTGDPIIDMIVLKYAPKKIGLAAV